MECWNMENEDVSADEPDTEGRRGRLEEVNESEANLLEESRIACEDDDNDPPRLQNCGTRQFGLSWNTPGRTEDLLVETLTGRLPTS